jgi:ABC-type lipoprotein release transport system permease subunit
MWWIKKFRKRKIQSILIFIVVAMCTTLITGSAVILTSLTSVYEDLANSTGAPDVKVYPRCDKDYESSLLKCKSVSKVTTLNRVTITTLGYNGKESDEFIDVVQYNDSVYKNVRVLQGSLDDLKDGTCFMPSATANTNGLNVGDMVQVQMSGKMYSYKIAGIYAEIYSAATEYTCDLVVLDLPSEVETQPVYDVWLKDGANCDTLIQEYTKDNNGILDGGFRAKADCVINAELTELILGGILLGISSVVFLAILLILGYIVKNCFQSDMETIAVYKTIGYSNALIRKIYITFYMSIIGAGAITGVLFSPLLSNTFINDVYKNIGTDSKGLRGGWQILVCLVVICGIAFIMLFTETRRLVKMKPVDILSGGNDKLGKKKLKASKKNHYRFSPFFMAVRMIRRDKKNTVLLMLTCVVSLYIVNLSVVCLQNIDLIKGETNYYWLGIDKHDITIENKGDKDEFYQICSEIKKDSNVKTAVRRNYDKGYAIPYHQATSAMVYETFDQVDSPILEGSYPKYQNQAVVANIYLKELGINIGDYITIQLDQDHRVNLLVVGTYQGFYNLGRGIKIMGSLLEENNVDFEYTQCSITLKDGVNVQSYMDELRSKYSNQIKVINRKNLYTSIMNTVCDPQRAALLPFTIITVLIGAMNAFYIIYASNVEKRKKYTIYKSLGYTSMHLLKMNCIYVGLIVALAIAIAVPAFIFIFPKIMVLAMSAFGFAEYKMVVEPLTLVLTNIGMLSVFLLAACIAAIELFKNHIAKIMNE